MHNPLHDCFITSKACVNAADIDLAVGSGKEAFCSGEWSTFSSAQHASCLSKLAELLDAYAGEFGRLETHAMGTQ